MKMKLVDEAYDVLSNETSRMEYDSSILLRQQQQQQQQSAYYRHPVYPLISNIHRDKHYDPGRR
jgi:curved DNA-binding protein CbpA